MRPDKSEWVPSCEKWKCHHVASLVVRTDTSTPTGSDSTASLPTRCAMSEASAAGRALRSAAGAVVETIDGVALVRRVVVLTAGTTMSRRVACTGAVSAATCERVAVAADIMAPSRTGGALGASQRVVGDIRDSRSVRCVSPVPVVPP